MTTPGMGGVHHDVAADQRVPCVTLIDLRRKLHIRCLFDGRETALASNPVPAPRPQSRPGASGAPPLTDILPAGFYAPEQAPLSGRPSQ